MGEKKIRFFPKQNKINKKKTTTTITTTTKTTKIYGLQQKIPARRRSLVLWHPKGKSKLVNLRMKGISLMNWQVQCQWIILFGRTFLLDNGVLTMSFGQCYTSSVQGDLSCENKSEFLLTEQAPSSSITLHYPLYSHYSTSSSHQGLSDTSMCIPQGSCFDIFLATFPSSWCSQMTHASWFEALNK